MHNDDMLSRVGRASLVEAMDVRSDGYEVIAGALTQRFVPVTPLASDSTAPSHGHNHPAARAVHAIHDAAVIATSLGTGEDEEPQQTQYPPFWMFGARRILELLTEAGEHVGALNVLLERQERLIEEQRIESLRLSRDKSDLALAVTTLTRQLDDERHARVIEENAGVAS